MIILAIWEDIYRQPFLYEAFSIESDPDTILDQFIYAKAFFKKEIISKNENSINFNDGSSVTLLQLPIQNISKYEPPLQLEESHEESGEHF
jgi:hypothetical protein